VSFRHARGSQGTRRACTKCGSSSKASQATAATIWQTQKESNSIRATQARKCRIHPRNQSINLGIQSSSTRKIQMYKECVSTTHLSTSTVQRIPFLYLALIR
jgi:hypothetical protein